MFFRVWGLLVCVCALILDWPPPGCVRTPPQDLCAEHGDGSKRLLLMVSAGLDKVSVWGGGEEGPAGGQWRSPLTPKAPPLP